MQKYLRNKRDESIYHTEKAAQPTMGLRRLTLYGLLLVDTVSHRISAEAHAGDLHDGRDHLALSIDKLGRVLAVLTRYCQSLSILLQTLAKVTLRETSGKVTTKTMGFRLALWCHRRCIASSIEMSSFVQDSFFMVGRLLIRMAAGHRHPPASQNQMPVWCKRHRG